MENCVNGDFQNYLSKGSVNTFFLNTKVVFIINFDEIIIWTQSPSSTYLIKKSSKADLYCLYFECGRGRHTSYKLLLKNIKMHHLPLKNHVKSKHDYSRIINIQFCWLKLVPNDFSLVVTKTIITVITS